MFPLSHYDERKHCIRKKKRRTHNKGKEIKRRKISENGITVVIILFFRGSQRTKVDLFRLKILNNYSD